MHYSWILLLDPAPFQIWIANRADLLPGSVTDNDPMTVELLEVRVG